ncbi:MAG: hypothetical protein AAGC67_05835 [Myxococcota bacterium]
MTRLDSISLSVLSRAFAVGLAASALLLALAMGLGWRQAERLQTDLETVAARTEAKTVWFATLQGALGYGGLIHEFQGLALSRDPARIERGRAHLARARAALAAYVAEGLSPSEEAFLADLNAVLLSYERALSHVEAALAGGASSAEIRRNMGVDDAPALAAITGLERELSRMRVGASAHVGEVVAQLNRIAKITFFGGAGLLLLATLAVFWFAERRLASPIAELVAKAERLSRGDLRAETGGGAARV